MPKKKSNGLTTYRRHREFLAPLTTAELAEIDGADDEEALLDSADPPDELVTDRLKRNGRTKGPARNK